MRVPSVVRTWLRRAVRGVDDFPNLDRNVLPVRSLRHLMTAMGWTRQPVVDGAHLDEFQYLEDLNDRRRRDAEVLAAAARNEGRGIILEIGTGRGRSTTLMARNAPNAVVHTVNIPPEEILDGGIAVTGAVALESIGEEYRAAGCSNVVQVLANTRDWVPYFGPIDVAFIDGCHDADFVFNDTVRAIARCRPGAVIVWHDFAPGLARVYPWIHEVCSGVERLYREGVISGRILHLDDSWTGLYRIPSDRR